MDRDAIYPCPDDQNPIKKFYDPKEINFMVDFDANMDNYILVS